DRKDIAFLESTFSQARGHAPHGGFELRIGVASAARSIDQRRLVFDQIGRVEDEIGERDFRDRDFRVWSAKNHYLGVRRLDGALLFLNWRIKKRRQAAALQERSLYMILLTKQQLPLYIDAVRMGPMNIICFATFFK